MGDEIVNGMYVFHNQVTPLWLWQLDYNFNTLATAGKGNTLAGMSDVDMTNLSSVGGFPMLVYNSQTSKWIPANLSGPPFAVPGPSGPFLEVRADGSGRMGPHVGAAADNFYWDTTGQFTLTGNSGITSATISNFGSTANDIILTCTNGSAAQLFKLRGDGTGFIGPNAQNCLQWDVSGHFSTLGTATLPGGSGGGATSLSQLSDVSVSGQTNGQVLTWNTSAARWVNQNPTGGGGVTTPLTLAAPSPAATTLTVNGAAGFPTELITGSSTSGSSQGLKIVAGFNAADIVIQASNYTQSPPFFLAVYGDGHGYLGPNSSNSGMNWTATGNYFFSSTSGTTVTIGGGGGGGNALSVGTGGNTAMLIRSDNTGYIGPNAGNCLQWSSTGAFSLVGTASLPGSGGSITTPLTLQAPPGNPNQNTLTIFGSTGLANNAIVEISPGLQTLSNAWMMQMGGAAAGQTAGFSNGLLVLAGTNASDASLKVNNYNGSSTYMLIRGDGSGTLGQGITWDAVGNVTINTPPPSTANQWLMQLGGGTASAAGMSFGLQVIAGTNSTDTALSVENDAATAEMLHIAGDGTGWLGLNSSFNLTWNTTGFAINGSTISAVNIPTFSVTGPPNGFALVATNGTTVAGKGSASFGGMTSNAGTVVLQVVGTDWVNTFLKIYADGHGQIGSSTSNYLGWDTTGAFTLHGTATLPGGGGGLTPPVTISGAPNTVPLTVNRSSANTTANQYVVKIQDTVSASGNSCGLIVQAGAGSATEYPLLVQNGAGAVNLLAIAGDGSGFMGPASGTRFSWNAAGDFSINTDLNCTSGLYASQTSSSGTWWAIKATNPTSAAGFNNGVNITAGRSSADNSLLVQDYSATNTYFQIAGNGTGTLGPSATNCLKWDASGHFTLSGTATLPGATVTPPLTLDMTGLATTGQALLCRAPNDATSATTGGWCAIMQAPQAGQGRGNGLQVVGGNTSTDYILQALKVGYSATCFALFNNGTGYLGPGGTNSSLNWDGLGNWSLPQGTFIVSSSGTGAIALTAGRYAAVTAATVFVAKIGDNKSAAGFNNGLIVQAGISSANEYPFLVQNSAGSANWFALKGDGSVLFPTMATQTTGSAASAYVDATTGQLLRSTSARKYKKNIKSVSRKRAREIVQKLQAVTFNSLCAADDPKRKHYGLVAEDVAEVEPALVEFDADGKPSGVQYERVLLLLLPLMQELLGEPS